MYTKKYSRSAICNTFSIYKLGSLKTSEELLMHE